MAPYGQSYQASALSSNSIDTDHDFDNDTVRPDGGNALAGAHLNG